MGLKRSQYLYTDKHLFSDRLLEAFLPDLMREMLRSNEVDAEGR